MSSSFHVLPFTFGIVFFFTVTDSFFFFLQNFFFLPSEFPKIQLQLTPCHPRDQGPWIKKNVIAHNSKVSHNPKVNCISVNMSFLFVHFYKLYFLNFVF